MKRIYKVEWFLTKTWVRMDRWMSDIDEAKKLCRSLMMIEDIAHPTVVEYVEEDVSEGFKYSRHISGNV